MATIPNGRYATVSVQIGRALRVSGAGLGTITRLPVPIGQGEPGSPVQFTGTTANFGPYDVLAVFRVDCTAGTLDATSVPAPAGQTGLTPINGTFLTTAAPGTIIGSPTDPYDGKGYGVTTWSTWNNVPPQLSLTGANIVVGNTAGVADTDYTISVMATSGDGKRRVGDTFSLRALQGAVTPTPLPLPSTPRLAVASVTPSFTDSAFVTAMQAQHTNKANVSRTWAQGESFTFTLPAGITAPSGGFFWDAAITAAAAPAPLFEYSDNGGTSWTVIPNNVFAPSGDASANASNARGQMAYPPAGPASRLYRMTPNTVSATAITVQIGIRQIMPTNNEIFCTASNSTGLSGYRSPGLMVAKAKAIDASYDPIIFVWSRGGSSPVECYSEQLVPGLAAHPYVSAVMGDFSLGKTVSDYRPFSNNSASQQSDLAQVGTNIQYCLNRGLKVYWTGVNFREYLSTDPAGTVTSANLDNGVRPFNKYVFDTFIRSLAPYNVNAAYDLPQINVEQAIYRDVAAYQQADRVHLTTDGDEQARIESARAFGHFYTGNFAGTISPARQIASVVGGTTTVEKAKVQAMLDALNPTAITSAQANRATLQAQLNAAPTGFVDPVLTGGAIRYGSVPGAVAWFDFTNYDMMFSDVAATTKSTDGGKTRAVKSRVGDHIIINPASGTASPLTVSNGINGKWSLSFATQYLSNMDTMIALMDAAAQPMTLFWVVRTSTANASVMGFGPSGVTVGQKSETSGTNFLAAQAIVGGATSLVEAATANMLPDTTYAFFFNYDGTTASIRRSDGLFTSGAKTKAANTSTAFRVGGNYNTANWNGLVADIGVGTQSVSATVQQNCLTGAVQYLGAKT